MFSLDRFPCSYSGTEIIYLLMYYGIVSTLLLIWDDKCGGNFIKIRKLCYISGVCSKYKYFSNMFYYFCNDVYL